ncbi:hypothetical protein HYX02_04765 [Candidatus Woesearchaeota archaeon]|nr:hypothetical protein [Candidatus Woesearchaeota archaeon]
MKPITSEQLSRLEQMLGFRVCPFTLIGKEDVVMGILVGEVPFEVYGCSVDGGNARGGTPIKIIPMLQGKDSVITPCSMKYAETCSLYSRVMGHQNTPPE